MTSDKFLKETYRLTRLFFEIWLQNRGLRFEYLSHPQWNVMVELDPPHIWFFYWTVFNNNIWPNSTPLRDNSLQYLSDLKFDLSRSLKVKSNGAVWLPIHDFLVVSNTNNYLKLLGAFLLAVDNTDVIGNRRQLTDLTIYGYPVTDTHNFTCFS